MGKETNLRNIWGEIIIGENNHPIHSLGGIAAGASIYCHFDEGFSLEGYFWPLVYFVAICAEMVLVKHILNTVKMTTWTRVYYNNALGLPPDLLFGVAMGEFSEVHWENDFTPVSITVLLVACVIGLGISFAGFHARKLLSATSFTVLGVSNKVISIVLSLLLFSNQSLRWESAAGLLMCITCGTLYAKTK